MKSSSSTSSILRLSEKSGGSHEQPHCASPQTSLRRSNSVTVLHQKQLPTYSAERFYILSELQLHSVPPTFLSEHPPHPQNNNDDSATADTMELFSLEGCSNNSSFENSQSSLPLQDYSILYLVWKLDRAVFQGTNSIDAAISAFCNESILPAVHKIQGITTIRRPSLGQSSSSSSSTLSRFGSEDDLNQHDIDNEDGGGIDDNDNDNNLNNSDDDAVNVPGRRSFGRADNTMPSTTNGGTRLYVVVEQVFDNATDGADTETDYFDEFERCATNLSRHVSTHAELRSLVQGITVGVSNQQRAAPGLEACMNAIHVGSQDRRRYGNRSQHGGPKSLIGLVADSYDDLVGPGDVHHHSHHHSHDDGIDHSVDTVVLRQCLVSAEWSAAGDLMTFSQRAHNVWRNRHNLPPLVSSKSLKTKSIRRVQAYSKEPAMTLAQTIYQVMWVCILLFYFLFHYRNDALELGLSLWQWIKQ